MFKIRARKILVRLPTNKIIQNIITVENMPIAKIPVVHNFGIISRTHQDEIKQKIYQKEVQRYKSPGPKSTPESSANPRYN